MRPGSLERRLWDPLTHGWQLVVSFLLGTLTALVNFDLADYLYFRRQAVPIPLTPFEQAWYYVILPGILYSALVVAAFTFGRSRRFHPVWFMYFFIALFLVGPLIAGLFLPQAHDPTWLATVLLGAGISIATAVGLTRQVRRVG